MTYFRLFIATAALSTSALAAPSALAQAQAGQININGQLVLAARAGQTSRVQTLLDSGAVVNSRNRNGDSSLNLAAEKGNEEMAAALIKAGADVNLANIKGVTPLMGAAFSAKPELIRSLLAAGAKADPLDQTKKSAAVYAAGSGCTDCLKQLLTATGQPVNQRLHNDLTLLMWAAAYGRDDTVKSLLAMGADKTMVDDRGKTALDIAKEQNLRATAALLGG